MRRYLLPDEVNTTGFTGVPGPSEESGPGPSGHSGYFDPSGPGSFSEVKVRGEEFHYLIHVLRYEKGSRFEGIDRRGFLYNLEITEVTPNSLTLHLQPKSPDDGTSGDDGNRPTFYLYQALLKGKKMDSVIRQAAATGIHHIIPLVTEHTVAKIETTQREEKKLARWNSVIKEALQQSGSTVITQLHSTEQLQNLKKSRFSSTLGLFFHEKPLENGSLHRYLSSCPQRIALFIGPEGGLSAAEVELLHGIGCRPVQLQTNILRSETAAVYAIGAVQSIAGEINQWKHVPQFQEATDTAEYQ